MDSFNKSLVMRRLASQIFTFNLFKKVLEGWVEYAKGRREMREGVMVIHQGYMMERVWDIWRHVYKQSKHIHKQRGKHMVFVVRGVWGAWKRYVEIVRGVLEKGYGVQVRQHRHMFEIWRKKVRVYALHATPFHTPLPSLYPYLYTPIC
ncbi:hypothetical protein EON63_15885 [archaeon]|nr:MAG: hypothetical protein EON63_15885 [archaeon]